MVKVGRMPWWRAAAVIAVAVGLVPAISTCSYDSTCDSSVIAFVLPEPGDELAAEAFVCVHPIRDASWDVAIELESSIDFAVDVVLEVDDPVGGPLTEVSFDDLQPEHCEAGAHVVVRRGDDLHDGDAIGGLHLSASVEDPRELRIDMAHGRCQWTFAGSALIETE